MQNEKKPANLMRNPATASDMALSFSSTHLSQCYKHCFNILIIKGIYDSTCVPHVDFVELSNDLIRTKGNNFKLIQHHCHLSL